LKEGDHNTKFFHQHAVWRARKNKISKLEDTNGVVQTVPTEMQRMAISYFKSLYTRDPSLNCQEIINLTPVQIIDDTNDQLCKDFFDEEISNALFQIGPIKAPGPDGFPARLYQRNTGHRSGLLGHPMYLYIQHNKRQVPHPLSLQVY
jgi:hypothetical protein